MAADRAAFRYDLQHEGYSKEEEYFHELNRELIESRRKQLDQERSAQQAAQKAAQHWMKCPKCGHEMKDAKLSNIQYEQCTNCQGIYFDPGEFETLLRTREQKSFLHALFRRFLRDMDQPDTSWRP